VSTDSIHIMAFCSLFLHLLTHNYEQSSSGRGDKDSETVDAVSLNAALFAAVCLASRLDSSDAAFALLTAATVAFVLAPLRGWRRQPWRRASLAAATFVAAGAATLIAFWLCSPVAAAAAVLAQTVVVAAAPALFVRWQRYKDTISGPWDEAVPNM